jgi:hypothetical protein
LYGIGPSPQGRSCTVRNISVEGGQDVLNREEGPEVLRSPIEQMGLYLRFRTDSLWVHCVREDTQIVKNLSSTAWTALLPNVPGMIWQNLP